MLSINTNLSSLIAQRSMTQATNILNQAIERMTTGYKINHASDNAANYSIATNMTTQISAYMVAEDNALQGLDMINTASESLTLIEDKLMRLRALAEQASNGTYGEQSKQAINSEANAIVDEIERLYNTTEYNGINLAKGRVVGTEESKFIKDIDRRDTSKMTTLASVDETQKLEYGTYSISTAEELAKLATMTNNGLIGADTEFVLGADIDLSGYSNWTPIGFDDYTSGHNPFKANFDGNGYTVRNLKINTSIGNMGLFGRCLGGIYNLALTDAEITTDSYSGSIASYSRVIENCYVENVSIDGLFSGALACSVDSTMDCYTKNVVVQGDRSSGLLGYAWRGALIENCGVFNMSVAGTSHSLFIGVNTDHGVVRDCAVEMKNCYYDDISYNNSNSAVKYYTSYSSDMPIIEDVNQMSAIDDILSAGINCYSTNIQFQIGDDSSDDAQLNVDVGYLLDSQSILRRIGKGTGDYLTLIDSLLTKASEKQTEFGAAQNRLESALDEISIKYENLVSSRSTIRDADIAEVSSTYIQQQILQQASATLLATANQSPAIALQLI